MSSIFLLYSYLLGLLLILIFVLIISSPPTSPPVLCPLFLCFGLLLHLERFFTQSRLCRIRRTRPSEEDEWLPPEAGEEAATAEEEAVVRARQKSFGQRGEVYTREGRVSSCFGNTVTRWIDCTREHEWMSSSSRYECLPSPSSVAGPVLCFLLLLLFHKGTQSLLPASNGIRIGGQESCSIVC